MHELRGVYVVLVTPFTSSNDVDEPPRVFRRVLYLSPATVAGALLATFWF